MKDSDVILEDIHGAYEGQLRYYSKEAAEVAIQSGFARIPEKRTEFPDEFPGRNDLMAAGFEAVEDVPDSFEALTDLPGVGKKTANAILEAVAAL